MTSNELFFFLAGISIGLDIALLVNFWPAIRDGHRVRRAAKTEAADQ